MSEQPCWPECKEMLLLQLQSEVARIEAVLSEREKAVQLVAKNEITNQQSEMMEKYVLREAHKDQIDNLQEQLTGSLGLELRMRAVEQSRGAMDAKLYMVIVGIPIAVSAIVAFITNILITHILK